MTIEYQGKKDVASPLPEELREQRRQGKLLARYIEEERREAVELALSKVKPVLIRSSAWMRYGVPIATLTAGLAAGYQLQSFMEVIRWLSLHVSNY